MKTNHLLVALASFCLASGSGLSNQDPQPASGSPAASADPGPNWDSICDKFGGTKADTKPLKDVTMAFTIATEVKEVLVQGGQMVKQGDLLVRARDDEQVAVVEGQKLQAENEYRIRNAELQKELADLTYKRIQQANAGGGANPAELDQRRIEAASAEVAVSQEKTTHELEVKRLAQAEGLLSRYRLNAQWDGIVEEVRVEAGQGVRESDPVIRVVDITKLKLEPFTPTQETLRLGLKQGSKAWVLISLPDKAVYVEGHVLYVSPVADSVSQTRRIQVEIDNPEGWPAGTPAMVRFTQPGPEWDANRFVSKKDTVSSASGSPTTSVSDAR